MPKLGPAIAAAPVASEERSSSDGAHEHRVASHRVVVDRGTGTLECVGEMLADDESS